MKTDLLSKALILCGCSALAASAFGSTVYLASGAGETTNNSGSATVNISANPLWSSAFTNTKWVSYTQSGNPNQAGYVSPANGTTVTFTDNFNINGTPTGGSLIAMADDTAAITVNGVLVQAMAPTANNTYTICSNFTTGCSAATTAGLNILSDLHAGSNTITFAVEQIAGASFGLDYSAAICFDPKTAASATPEPGTLALLSLPLIVLSQWRRKKKA